MKYFYLLYLNTFLAWSQSGTFSHFGTMQIHKDAAIGFHGNVLNWLPISENKGLCGFYGEHDNRVGGVSDLILYNAEIATPENIKLEVSVLIKNNLNYVFGDFIPERTTKAIATKFANGSFTNGASDFSKTNGLVIALETKEFTFPVGDSQHYRPLKFSSFETVDTLKCSYYNNAYLSENLRKFKIAEKPIALKAISDREYWKLSGNSKGSAILFWNENSRISELTEDIMQLEVVGLQRTSNQWIPLGILERSGTLTEGYARTNYFLPDDFEILTFGSRNHQKSEDPGNYYLSPNNDGRNDRLLFENTDELYENSLKIYDRRGLLVFESENYHQEFIGISNVRNAITEKNAGLPEGVYFYIFNSPKSGKTFQGFLYLDR